MGDITLRNIRLRADCEADDERRRNEALLILIGASSVVSLSKECHRLVLPYAGERLPERRAGGQARSKHRRSYDDDGGW